MATSQKITTYLWFDNNAEEAVTLYTSIFANSRIVRTVRWPEGAPGPTGQVLTMEFELEGQRFIALNGGPMYKFSPAISLLVSCTTQNEVDTLWTKLLEGGGRENKCGWLQDRFGLSWQVIPTALMTLMSDPDPRKAGHVTQAMLKMTKINIAELQAAHAG